MAGNISTKVCTRCGVEKPRSAYYKRANRPCGIASICKECDSERGRKRAKDDPERHAANARAWRERNPEKQAEYRRRWYERNKEEAKRKARQEARSRRANVKDPSTDTVTYEDVIELDPCSYCGAPGGSVDHIQPLVHGGAHDWKNLTASCLRCNQAKGKKTLLTFLRHRSLS